MRLRLYHHHDGARVAYRELGAGPPLALWHAAGLSHREWEPVARQLGERFRVVLPDLPLHGDSEDRPRHPYTLDWFAEVMGGFAADVGGRESLIAGHGVGAEIAVHAVLTGRLRVARLVLMPNRMHRRGERARSRAALGWAMRAGAVPGLDRLATHAVGALWTPQRGVRLSARGERAAGDLIRHALADVPGNPNLARS